jgi:FkbM family methyltransferase
LFDREEFGLNACELDQLHERLLRGGGESYFERQCGKLRHDRICMFGMGNYGLAILPFMKDLLGERLVCVSDNDPAKQNREFAGLRCVPPDELKAFKDICLFVSIVEGEDAQRELLMKGFDVINRASGLKESIAFRNRNAPKLYAEHWSDIQNVCDLLADAHSKRVFAHCLRYNLFPEDFSDSDETMPEVYSDGQYFPQDIVFLGKKEVFFDGGAFTGDTIQAFLKNCGNAFEHIFAFEPDAENFAGLERFLGKLPGSVASKITALQKGLWDRSEERRMRGTGTGVRVEENALTGNNAKLIALDEIGNGSVPATFVKMDVEGAERRALLGARKTVETHRPKLAVCVYHKPEDLYVIPMLIHELNPKYKLYLRHHGRNWWFANETVCYAI